ncbi:glycosyl transferase, group 1, putative [Gloeomargarita lithophora Alchichica-D10]|uniref:Glycosyl transferase, group 1, putative n=1 Tax=Gloeomargarita lithophora Alchichica-D10 TaxID=1188229 RepID=A0A1J0ADL4_9CYAN|nr:glycosyltransferase family 4 protein [Gloeomargarita lithophora]APB34028.1 glycosyl transferase, group 1, putative [Gloeomargarita lithophora Alchichica-D10]
MNILHLNTYDTSGGAARASYRLHQGLLKSGVNSQQLVLRKSSQDPTIHVYSESRLVKRLRVIADQWPLNFYPHHSRAFSTHWVPNLVPQKIKNFNFDILHIHWINGLLIPEFLPKITSQPMVWTFQDMWAITGGCHYTQGCDLFMNQCGYCPQLDSSRQNDLSHQVWQRKKKAWCNFQPVIITPSSWLANQVKSSPLLGHCDVKIIPNGLDTDRYRVIPKPMARQILQLPQEKKVILAGGVSLLKEPHKGWDLLCETAQMLPPDDGRLWVIFGQQQAPGFEGLPVRCLGSLTDDVALALAYSAADVLVVPSRQETFGQVATEAMACGTPVVAFAGTGVQDIVDHYTNGYLAQAFDPADLAAGIGWVLRQGLELGKNARQKVERAFDLTVVVQRHLELYQSLINA